MQADIKCLECGKATRHFELGRLFYVADRPSKSAIIENALIICPKCGKDISNGRFLIKEKEFLFSLIASKVGHILTKNGELPEHLRGALQVNKEDYALIKKRCKKSKPRFVEKF